MSNDEDQALQTQAIGQARKLFSKYPPTKGLCDESDKAAKDRLLTDHILKVRSAIYDVHPYPCISMFRFLYPTITQHPVYASTILPLLLSESSESSGPLFLDVGCCVGQVIRQLVVDGCKPTQLIGVDLYSEYITHGYDLFMDGPHSAYPLKSRLEAGNIFDPEFLVELNGRVTVIHIASVLHLFSWNRQQDIARRLDKLLVGRPECLIVGSQLGVRGGGELTPTEPRFRGSGVFRHDADTFKDLWTSVGSGNWDVEVIEHVWDVDLKKHPMKLAREGEEVIVLRFVVKRK
jgi:SAM-dependent methyltransferase